MEQIIAFKAFNGRLFETKEKCLEYEKKYAEYPKVKYSVIPQAEGVEKCVKSTWEKPSSQRKDESYFLVGGKIKVYVAGSNVGEMPCTDLVKYKQLSLDRVACNVILHNGITFNDELADILCGAYHYYGREINKECPPGKRIPFDAKVTETDHKTYWVIEDNAWINTGFSSNGRYVKIVK